MHIFAKLVVGTLIPRIVNEIYTLVTHNKEQLIKIPKDTVKNTLVRANKLKSAISMPRLGRKPKVDRTKFTKGMYDYATEAYNRQAKLLMHSKDFKLTHKSLTKHLNKVFKTNKSVTTMSRLFKGQLDRDCLPTGIAYARPKLLDQSLTKET